MPSTSDSVARCTAVDSLGDSDQTIRGNLTAGLGEEERSLQYILPLQDEINLGSTDLGVRHTVDWSDINQSQSNSSEYSSRSGEFIAIQQDGSTASWASGSEGEDSRSVAGLQSSDVVVIPFSRSRGFFDVLRFNENIAANSLVARFQSTEPNLNDRFTYSLVEGFGDRDNAAFTIQNDQLRIKQSPDYETQNSYSIRVRTTDSAGSFYEEELSLSVNDIDEVAYHGKLDRNFAGDGQIILDIAGRNDVAEHVISNRDGDVTVVGTTTQLTNQFGTDVALARYKTNGSLDDSFGNGGIVVDRNSEKFDFVQILDAIEDVRGGSLVLTYGTNLKSDLKPTILLTRYDSQGERDIDFGSNGQASLLFGTSQFIASTLSLDLMGNILVTGAVESTGVDFRNLGIVRYTSSGILDTSFGDDGKLLTSLSGDYEIGDRILLTDAGFYVTGAGEVIENGFRAARYFYDGSLDTSFGDDGQILLQQRVRASRVDNNGKLIVTYATQGNERNAILTRFDLTGNFDTSFGDGGQVIIPRTERYPVGIYDIVVDRFDQITFVGSTSLNDVVMARYGDDGEIDSSFGTEGITLTDFDGQFGAVTDVALDKNENLLISGRVSTSTGEDFVVARYSVLNPASDAQGPSANALFWNQLSGDVSLVDFSARRQASQTSLQRDLTDQNWQIKMLGDLNGDGQEDAVLRHISGQVLAWYLESDRPKITEERLIGRLLPQDWEIVGISDFNGDDQADLLLRNTEADQTLAWFMDIQGNILAETPVGRDFEDSRWQIEATADFTGDGQADLLLRHYGSGQNLLMEMDGTEIISERLIGRIVEDLNWHIVGAKDLNRDGEVDIILQNNLASQTLLWEMKDGQISQERLIQGTANPYSQLVL